MTKGAIVVFTLNLAKLLGPKEITVNAVSPGATRTGEAQHFVRPDRKDGFEATRLKERSRL